MTTYIEKLTPDQLVREGREYESRLFSGAYSLGRYTRSPCRSVTRRLIDRARENYNLVRSRVGYPPCTDWNRLPDKLVQHHKVS